MDIGSKGLAEVNLTIPQGTSLEFSVVHTDEEGNPIDHSESTANMAFQSKNGDIFHDLSDCCTCTESAIYVLIPASATKAMALGKLNWDLIVTAVSGSVTRLCYGSVSIVDTYALDETG